MFCLVEVFLFYMEMLYLIWRELGMGKFPHSWLSSHSETEFLHSRLRRSWRNTLSLFLLSHSWGNFFSRLRGFATQGGKIPSLILSRLEIAHSKWIGGDFFHVFLEKTKLASNEGFTVYPLIWCVLDVIKWPLFRCQGKLTVRESPNM